MNRKKVVITVAVCLAAAAAAAAGILYARRAQAAESQESGAPVLVPVQTVAPKTENLANTMDFIGTVSAGQTVSVMPKLTAKVLQVNVKTGDTVKAGDLLFTMDTSDLDTQVQLSQIALMSAQLSYELTTGTTLPKQENQAYLNYDAARDTYDNAEEAYDDLVGNKNKILSQMQGQATALQLQYSSYVDAHYPGLSNQAAWEQAQGAYSAARAAWQANPTDETLKAAMMTAKDALDQLESYKTAYESAAASVATYQNSVTQASAGLDAAERSYNAAKIAYESVSGEARQTQEQLAALQLQQAQTNYDGVMKQLKNAKVTAPAAGQVMSVNVQQNNYASPSSPAVVLGSTQMMKLVFGVPAHYFSQIGLGDQVTVSAMGQTLSANISEIAPSVNAQNGLFNITAEFAGDGSLLSGAAATATLETERAPDALTIPVDCVRYENNAPYVYLDKNGVAKKVFVTLGITDETVYQVKSGLETSDRVISTWHPNLTDGAAVSAQ